MKPDIIRDFFPYHLASVRLRPLLAEAADLRAANKPRKLAALLKRIESSPDWPVVKRFEELHCADPLFARKARKALPSVRGAPSTR